jgi:hypothetical protein
VITSLELTPGTFDPTRRLSKSDLLQGIHDFAADVKHRSDPKKQTLVIVYYFGHGLADGTSKSVFLVPEQFVDDETKTIANIGSRLINVADITQQLSEVTDHSILLIDACRAYKDQAKELIELWKKSMHQDSDISGILNALQFASGIYGPTPVLFASDDGMAADTVRDSAVGLTSGTGPLALKLRNVLDSVDSSGEGLPLAGLIRAFESPTPPTEGLNAQEASKVRGYSFLRKDFVDQFGNSLIVSATPLVILPRAQAFVSPFAGFSSHAGGTTLPPMSPSGIVRPVRVERPGAANIEELVFAPEIGLVGRDDTNEIWIRTTGKWRRFRKDFPIVRVGLDTKIGLMLYQWDEQILYTLHSAELVPIYRNFHSEFLGSGARGGLVVIQSVGGGRWSFLYAHEGVMHEVTQVVVPEVFDAAMDSHGHLWFTTAEGLWLHQGMETKSVGASLWRPHTILAMNDSVFVWSEDGRILYRLDAGTGEADALDLRDLGFGDVYVTREDTRSFAMRDLHSGFFGFGPDIVELSLDHASWHRMGGERLLML